jgi:hypothetical protein
MISRAEAKLVSLRSFLFYIFLSLTVKKIVDTPAKQKSRPEIVARWRGIQFSFAR